MLMRRFVIPIVSSMLVAAGTASGQGFPSRPIRMITSAPGGGTDFIGRLITPGLLENLGQQVIIDNRGLVGVEVVAKATPDGYTLLIYGAALFLLPLMRSNAPYDAVRDFMPISQTDQAPNVLVVHPSVAASSVKELIALAKARPGELNYGRATAGGPPHLSAELFKAMAGVNLTSVPYKGGGPVVIGLLGGEVQIMFAAVGSVIAHVKSGRLKALAVTSPGPTVLFPGLPAVAATIPGYEAAAMNGVYAPAGTPRAIINRLNQAIVHALNKPEVKDKAFASGVEIVGSSPSEFAAKVKSEIDKWGKVIREAGIRDE